MPVNVCYLSFWCACVCLFFIPLFLSVCVCLCVCYISLFFSLFKFLFHFSSPLSLNIPLLTTSFLLAITLSFLSSFLSFIHFFLPGPPSLMQSHFSTLTNDCKHLTYPSSLPHTLTHHSSLLTPCYLLALSSAREKPAPSSTLQFNGRSQRVFIVPSFT